MDPKQITKAFFEWLENVVVYPLLDPAPQSFTPIYKAIKQVSRNIVTVSGNLGLRLCVIEPLLQPVHKIVRQFQSEIYNAVYRGGNSRADQVQNCFPNLDIVNTGNAVGDGLSDLPPVYAFNPTRQAFS